ncbi:MULTISPECIES: flagellar export chaperone FliS [unclassified Clostridioides]|uniref:flagellar export chaperone FliS n=1 Tax=unclassified Clostridioides TaxID=2635829 RepID=UPI001D0F55EE|nr:flagellar export chaperone FliS [Clostridioides sp. ES-S-0049-03]MCC0657953.1 flagellar export chaperone FliS [Clostridioides sp. ES-S-0123-01]MCC0677210.1 flagellar export chaperone FliS [Clostridioides sp. ES-W-0018-02]MCC0712075.1 flagellar export chaperone FliS [Clostridioides sp. ES-W-0017-02]
MSLNIEKLQYSSQEQLLLMLVDGAVKYTRVARAAIVDNDMDSAHKELIRVQDIFAELMVTLNQDAGQWAKDMYKVYDFIKYKLSNADLNNGIQIIDEVFPIIEQIRDIWYEASRKSRE